MNMYVTLDALIVTYSLVMTFFPVTYLHWYTRREAYQWTLDRYEDAAERRAKLARSLVRTRWRTVAGAGVVVSAWFWIAGWLPQALFALPAFAALALLSVMPVFVPALRLAQAKRFDEFGFPPAAGPSRTASSALRRLTDYLPRYWIVLPAIIVVAGSLIVGWVSLSAATVSGALLAAEAVMLVIVLEFLWYSWRQLRRAPGLLPPDLTDAVDPAVLGELGPSAAHGLSPALLDSPPRDHRGGGKPDRRLGELVCGHCERCTAGSGSRHVGNSLGVPVVLVAAVAASTGFVAPRPDGRCGPSGLGRGVRGAPPLFVAWRLLRCNVLLGARPGLGDRDRDDVGLSPLGSEWRGSWHGGRPYERRLGWRVCHHCLSQAHGAPQNSSGRTRGCSLVEIGPRMVLQSLKGQTDRNCLDSHFTSPDRRFDWLYGAMVRLDPRAHYQWQLGIAVATGVFAPSRRVVVVVEIAEAP